MAPADLTRRDFLGLSGGAAWLAATWPAIAAAGSAAATARDQAAAFEYLDEALARDLAAMAERILPADDLPGASDAGVVFFFDRALGTFAADRRDLVVAGVAGLNAGPGERKDDRGRFADLPPAEQDRLLVSVEATPFFGVLRFLTLAGMFAMPTYGGNRDHLGWELLGFPHQHAWAPPFGHYDAEASMTGDEHADV